MKISTIVTQIRTVQYKIELDVPDNFEGDLREHLRKEADYLKNIALENISYIAGRNDCQVTLNVEEVHVAPIVNFKLPPHPELPILQSYVPGEIKIKKDK